MISEKIKQLRENAGMTQKTLAEKLCVSPQAVSRWESGDTEPSAATLDAIATIFGVTLDELFGREPPKPEVVVKKETVFTAAPAVLGVCDTCKKAITDPGDYITVTHYSGRTRVESCRCKACDEKIKEQKHRAAVAHGIECRKRSFIWGGVITGTLMIIALVTTTALNLNIGIVIGATAGTLLFFPFLSCLFLKNNFVEDMFLGVASFGFVRFPGLIFSLDLDGIIWLLTVKLLFWILGFALAIAAFLLAVVLGLVVSVFVYPYALRKSIKYPEKAEI
ncbi:MAG: helix-turn-helix transcriptional regulator [Clostridia bacterium]|nr:helix-turn-helix transcriptional regulator [Clostridia bacterium]